MNESQTAMTHEPAPRPLASISGAHVAYGERQVLRGLTFELFTDEILVLLGPNGAGKSTLVKALSGRLRLDRGSVRIAGFDPYANANARRISGIVPQQIALFEKLTPLENFTAFAHLMGVPRREIAARAKQTLDLIGLAERSKDRVCDLSGGMRRRVNIGAALMHKPRLLVLDEPTVGVDFRARQSLAALLRRLRDEGLAILLTTHDLQEAESLADRVAVIVDGQIKAQGHPRQLVERVFGNRKQLTVAFPPASPEDIRSGYARALSAAGLKLSADGRGWSGLIVTQDAHVLALLNHLISNRAIAAEIRIREPGLELLLGAFMHPAAAPAPVSTARAPAAAAAVTGASS